MTSQPPPPKNVPPEKKQHKDTAIEQKQLGRANVSGNQSQSVEPTTQEGANFRRRWPAWAKQLPVMKFNRKPDENYQLIDRKILDESLAGLPEEVINSIKEDLKFLDEDLVRLFRQRDFDASLHQNRYRLYQIGFMGLAAAAAIFGSIQAVSFGSMPNIVPLLALVETIIALFTTYLATISGREPSLPLWTRNRRHAEHMRRELFRYITRLAPYDDPDLKPCERRKLLSIRVANINRGQYQDDQASAAT